VRRKVPSPSGFGKIGLEPRATCALRCFGAAIYRMTGATLLLGREEINDLLTAVIPATYGSAALMTSIAMGALAS